MVVDSLKAALVALGHGTAASYTGTTVEYVLKELAVVAGVASSVNEVRKQGIRDVLQLIADNSGAEENEPYDLAITQTNVTVSVLREGKSLSAGSDILYNGDKLTISAVGAAGYELDTLTVNTVAHESGSIYEVSGHNLAVVATGKVAKFDLARTVTGCTVTVTKSGTAVADGTDVLTYNDVITITATATSGTMKTLTVNGEDFTSGNTLTVTADVTIVAVAE